jgi:hypothetical protein
MDSLYSAADPIEAEILRGYLENHGIAVDVVGAALWGASGELPAGSGPRLLLRDDADRDRARELLRVYEHRRHAGASWICRCGEPSPIHFETCWACGQERPA